MPFNDECRGSLLRRLWVPAHPCFAIAPDAVHSCGDLDRSCARYRLRIISRIDRPLSPRIKGHLVMVRDQQTVGAHGSFSGELSSANGASVHAQFSTGLFLHGNPVTVTTLKEGPVTVTKLPARWFEFWRYDDGECCL
jgi:hypothetical protein